MTNVEKLEGIGILGDIRQRQGSCDDNDDSFDDRINELSNNQLIREYCAWHLGSPDWWDDMKKNFNELEELDQENN